MMMRASSNGFTLVEMVVVIAIVGIIGGMVAVFITNPVRGYVDSVRRAEMTDIADTALRRMTRDIQTALPNSMRVTACGTGQCLEYLETVAGGRYKSDDCLLVGGCTALTTTGDLVNGASGVASTALVNGGTLLPNVMRVAVYNQYNNSGNDCSPTNPSVYCVAANGGAAIITGVTNGANGANPEDRISFASTTFIPAGGSPFNRFQIISQPVTYACIPAAGGGASGTLTRYWGYDIQPTQPDTIMAGNLVVTGATPPQHPLLAENVAACSIVYDSTALRSALVTMQLTLTRDGESLTIYKATHVGNVP